MRKKRCEITENQVMEDILTRCRVGRFATVGADGFPYIVPVNYVYWNGSIYFHCAREGEKMDNLRARPKVCFEVDIPLAYLDSTYLPQGMPPCTVHQFYHSVIIRGLAEVVEDSKEKVDALNALVASHEPGVKLVEITKETPAVDICAVVAVRILSMTGKSDLAQKKSGPEKQQLAAYLKERGLPGDEEAARLINDVST